MAINYEFEKRETEKLYGNQIYETDKDFDSKDNLIQYLKKIFENCTCEYCGGHRISGNGLIVEVGIVQMYKQEKKKKFFGGEKWVDIRWKTVWRIYDMYLKGRKFLIPAGSLKCLSCKNKVKGYHTISHDSSYFSLPDLEDNSSKKEEISIDRMRNMTQEEKNSYNGKKQHGNYCSICGNKILEYGAVIRSETGSIIPAVAYCNSCGGYVCYCEKCSKYYIESEDPRIIATHCQYGCDKIDTPWCQVKDGWC